MCLHVCTGTIALYTVHILYRSIVINYSSGGLHVVSYITDTI